MDKSLAFELVVLEWALATASKLLCEEALAFEQASLPVLDNIAKKVMQRGPTYSAQDAVQQYLSLVSTTFASVLLRPLAARRLPKHCLVLGAMGGGGGKGGGVPI